MRLAAILVSLLTAVTILTGCATAVTPASSAGAGSASPGASSAVSIVSERCTRCHSTDRIKKASHDKAGWEGTVSRMRGKGAQLSDAEAAQVVDFLAGGGASQL